MKRNILVLALIFSVAVNIGILGSVGYHWLKKKGGERHHQEAQHSPLGFLAKELRLSPSQIREIESLRKSLEPKLEEIREKLREKRAQLVNMLKEPEHDSAKINLLIKEIESLQTKLQKIAINHLLQEKKILTPEQQEKFFSIVSKRLFHEERHQTEELLPMKKKSGKDCRYE